VISAEVLKLRTIRSPWLLLLGAQLVIVIGASGRLTKADATSAAAQQTAVAHVGLTSLFALIFGILIVAIEYRHRTISDTFLTTPRRGRVVGAKLAVAGLAGVGFGVVGAVTAFATTLAWVSAKGGSLSWSDGELWRIVLGDIGWNALFAAIGAALGALIRNLAGAVALALAWLALVEGVVGQLLGSGLSRWLPVSAGTALGRIPASVSDGLPQWGAAVVLVLYAAVFAAVALATTVRRDIA
jgi:ABC-2 type transport system permease protein